MKVIITGANGFLGKCLVKKFLDANYEVYAIDIGFNKSFFDGNKLVHKIECSLEHIDLKKDLLPTGDVIFYHLAWRGVNGPEKAEPLIQIANINMALKCAQICKDLHYKKFLCAGTIAERAVESISKMTKAYGGLTYGIAKHCTHLMIETYCKANNLDFVWMQFSNIYGPENKTGNLVSYTLGELLNDRDAIFGPANQPYDFVFVEDLIDAAYRLGIYQTTKNFYYIGSGSPRLLKEYLLEIGRKCNKQERIRIGLRPDDGVKYTFEMFDNSSLIADIGEYVPDSFENRILYTISKF